ncbi:MAG: GlsB/YeaQ/YmgE family stress response membrane protein [Methanoregulaceae archaeon]|jgi:uncharacterized membrane protein YeaQ/YmgE (transglycosylase-associated protein family)|nr:GlsB/YeaQ/YmgE family stress response membrane protein [Methanoregulaceae archaeon]
MNIVYWIIVGFVAGVLAKALVKGDRHEPKGCLFTIVLGICGSVATGFAMQLLGFTGQGGLIPTIIGATIGAVVLILLLRNLVK